MSTSTEGPRILYGANPVFEAIRAGRRIERIWVASSGKARTGRRLEKLLSFRDRDQWPPIEKIEPSGLQKICRRGDHQGIVAKVAPLPRASLKRMMLERGLDLFVLVLDGIQDPHNLGAIYRVADAGGVDLVFLPSRGSASHQLPSVAKTSAGAVEHVATVVVSRLKTAVEELKSAGFTVWALEAGKQKPLPASLARPLALIVGGEDRGVSSSLAAMADGYCSLPMRGRVNSLNVSTAAAVAVYMVPASGGGRTGPIDVGRTGSS